MLRRDQWFHAATDNELVNEDRDAKIWLDWASKQMRRHMYDRRAQFVRSTKVADKDFCAFGNAVLTRDQLGNDLVAWINYQPLYQQITRSEADLFG